MTPSAEVKEERKKQEGEAEGVQKHMPPQETEEEPTPSTPRGATRRPDDDVMEDAKEDDAVAKKARVGRESMDERGEKRGLWESHRLEALPRNR